MNPYINLVGHVIDDGERRFSRVGPTRQLFGMRMLWQMQKGFPILTTRRIAYKGILGELAAFLQACNHVEQFKKFGCNYWDADAERWAHDGWLGRIYGVQWRKWRTYVGGMPHETDQIKNLVDGITKDPFGRRHLITAWNPGELHEMALPPCHIFAQFNVSPGDRMIDCIVYMRSVDLCLGLPSDLVLYGALLHLVGEATRLQPRNLQFVLGDCHVYENHIDIWKQQQENRLTRSHPRWQNQEGNGLDNFDPSLVHLIGYDPADKIVYPLNTEEVHYVQ